MLTVNVDATTDNSLKKVLFKHAQKFTRGNLTKPQLGQLKKIEQINRKMALMFASF